MFYTEPFLLFDPYLDVFLDLMFPRMKIINTYSSLLRSPEAMWFPLGNFIFVDNFDNLFFDEVFQLLLVLSRLIVVPVAPTFFRNLIIIHRSVIIRIHWFQSFVDSQELLFHVTVRQFEIKCDHYCKKLISSRSRMLP